MDTQTETMETRNGHYGVELPGLEERPAGTQAQWCTQCGSEMRADSQFCYRCGSAAYAADATMLVPASVAPAAAQTMTQPTVESMLVRPVGEPFPTALAIASGVCSLIALAFFPPVFGAIAVVLAFFARRTNRVVGNWLIGIGVSCAVLGMIFGVLVYAATA